MSEEVFKCPCWSIPTSKPPMCKPDCLYQASKEHNRTCTRHDGCIGKPAIECDTCVNDYWEKVDVIKAVTKKCNCNNNVELAKDCKVCHLKLMEILVPSFPVCLCYDRYYNYDEYNDDDLDCKKDCKYQLGKVYKNWYPGEPPWGFSDHHIQMYVWKNEDNK